jgi:predicted transposase/invertase (TIGR01784 family)
MQLSALYIKQQQEWKEEGRLEEKQEVAIALLKEGLSPELIAKATGLSLETIHQLQT